MSRTWLGAFSQNRRVMCKTDVGDLVFVYPTFPCSAGSQAIAGFTLHIRQTRACLSELVPTRD